MLEVLVDLSFMTVSFDLRILKKNNNNTVIHLLIANPNFPTHTHSHKFNKLSNKKLICNTSLY